MLPKHDNTKKLLMTSLGLDEPESLKFGDWLVRRGLIDRSMLFHALSESYKKRCRVGAAIVSLGYVDRDVIEEEARSHSTFRAFG
jgi:hypothetical protein